MTRYLNYFMNIIKNEHLTNNIEKKIHIDVSLYSPCGKIYLIQ